MAGENDQAQAHELRLGDYTRQHELLERVRDSPEDLQHFVCLWNKLARDAVVVVQTPPDSIGQVLSRVQPTSKEFLSVTHILTWWCDTGPYSIDPTPITEVLRFAEGLQAYSRFMPSSLSMGQTRIVRECLLNYLNAFTQSHYTLMRMLFTAFIATGKELPEDLSKLIEPKQETREVIGYIQQGLDNEAIHERTDKTATAVRKTRSRLEKGEYDLET